MNREDGRADWEHAWKGNGASPYPSRILTGDAFISGYKPPDWLIKGIVQRGRLYACTSLTGHGKTAVWLFNACMIQAGRMVGHLATRQGNVLYLAGENPEDLRARGHGMCRTYGLRPAQLPYFLPGAFPMTEEETTSLFGDILAIGEPLTLIVGDTAASFFPGEDENDNVAAGSYARTLRSLTETVPGHPALVVLSHPTKHAGRDNLLPRGGGAFLNELDGNLTLWSSDLGQAATLHWQGKIRGPDFSAFDYKLRTVATGYEDETGEPDLTVIAAPISEEEAANRSQQALMDEDVLLKALRDHPEWSFGVIARELGWLSEADEPMKAKVQRTIHALSADNLVAQARKGAPWKPTKKGLDTLHDRGW